MRPLGSLALALAFAFGALAPAANATPDRDRDRDRGGQGTTTAPTANRSSVITPGNCVPGDDQKDLDINNVRARMYNIGNLFWRGATPIYIVPQTGDAAAIFAGGIWVGGNVGSELRIAAARYDNYEFWPGPLNADGSLPNASDCEGYDRLYKVNRTDILDYESGLGAKPDLRDWPWQLGAPVIAARNNGTDDDGDGAVDEGTDGVTNDDDNGDGILCGGTVPCGVGVEPDRVDERDEQERRTDGYDLAAGDRPDIIGDQTVWWVMNDVGNTHDETGSNPLGMEIRVQAWAFARADALNSVTFYKYTLVYRGEAPLTDAFIGIFSDPDLGDAVDDYIGSNPDLGVGYVYNADNSDDGAGAYGSPPPALGYDFLQGPIAGGDTLQMTRFGYYNNGGSATGDPSNALEYYRTMTGFFREGQPWTEGGDGTNPASTPVNFVYPGTPGQYWSEGCINPACSASNAPNDRRFVLSTGPFTMNPGDTQDVVYAIVWALGSDNLNSVQAMFNADQLAQTAYNVDFELPTPPDAPSVTATELTGRLILNWSYTPTSNNYLGRYSTLDPLCVAAGNPEETCSYEFEGFNVYRYDDASDTDPELIATFDVINGITQVIDYAPNETGILAPFIAARGTDSGIQYSLEIPNLTDFQDYYYGVSAYGFNDESVPKVLEGAIAKVDGRPSDITIGQGGAFINSERGDLIVATRTTGGGAAALGVRVVDPTAVVPGNYTVQFYTFTDDQGTADPADDVVVPGYDVIRDGTVIFSARDTYEETGLLVAEVGTSAFEALTSDRNIVIDGLEFFTPVVENSPPGDSDGVPDISGGATEAAGDNADGIIEVSYGGNTTTCPDPTNAATDIGCTYFPGNTVYHNGGITDDYYVTGGAGTGLSDRFKRFIYTAAPDQFEMRFTSAGGYGIYYFLANASADMIAHVPYELWNIRNTPDDTSDDIRMIPFLNAAPGGAPLGSAEQVNYYSGNDPWAGKPRPVVPITEPVYWMMPDRPNGYALFEAAALASGGPGSIYVEADTQIDVDPHDGSDCDNQGYFADFCYRNTEPETNAYPTLGNTGNNFVYPIGRFAVADLEGTGTTPPAGTTIRIITAPQPAIRPDDVFTFSTTDLAFTTGSADTLQASIDEINIVPNPYRGYSVYEAGNESRIARFVNLPDRATIRIFSLSGTLLRTLQAANTRSLDWDLNTEAGLPVASGMYLIHIEVKDTAGSVIGERVLRFGVVQRQIRVSNL